MIITLKSAYMTIFNFLALCFKIQPFEAVLRTFRSSAKADFPEKMT